MKNLCWAVSKYEKYKIYLNDFIASGDARIFHSSQETWTSSLCYSGIYLIEVEGNYWQLIADSRKLYIISTAFTKYVKRKGRVNQNHSGLKYSKPAQALAETMVINQYIPVFLFSVLLISVSMRRFCAANITFLCHLGKDWAERQNGGRAESQGRYKI